MTLFRSATLPDLDPDRGDDAQRIKRIVDRARRDSLKALRADHLTSWNRARLTGTLGRLAETSSRMAREFGTELDAGVRRAADEAYEDVHALGDRYERELQLRQMPFDRAALDAIMRVDAGLITQLDAMARSRMAAAIQQAVLRELPPESLFERLAQSMNRPTPHPRDPYGAVQNRAHTIWRTETLRVASQAADQRMGQWNQRRPGLMKSWRAAADGLTRPEHVEAGRRYKVGGTPGPIPVDEPYIVDGVRMMYPRDPSAPARLTVNCRCSSVPYRPQWDGKGGPMPPALNSRTVGGRGRVPGKAVPKPTHTRRGRPATPRREPGAGVAPSDVPRRTTAKPAASKARPKPAKAPARSDPLGHLMATSDEG